MGAKVKTTKSTPRRSLPCFAEATSPWPTSTPERCAQPGICCAAETTSCENALNSSLISKTPTANTTYQSLAKSSPTRQTVKVLPSTSPTLPSARVSRSIFNCSTSTTSSSMTSNSISSKRPKWTMPTAGIVCEVSPESAKSSASSYSMKSTISNGFPESRTSSPIAAWSNAPENQLEKSSVLKIARSETLTSSGLSLKRLVFS